MRPALVLSARRAPGLGETPRTISQDPLRPTTLVLLTMVKQGRCVGRARVFHLTRWLPSSKRMRIRIRLRLRPPRRFPGAVLPAHQAVRAVWAVWAVRAVGPGDTGGPPPGN